ncbi:MAG: GTP 3',8-cyclase MoaA [Ignavibacteriae bacterium]|nr:MAG: GTP 3',8-cyclase MoaA [Ignavibacteriota bacterium]
MKKELKDKFGRVHNYLRISLTDACNLNCIYCNPVSNTAKTNNNKFLSFEEIYRLINIFASHLGTRKIRFTGGEPLARKNVLQLFERIKPLKQKFDLEYCLTTNGTLLQNRLEELTNAGIDRFNISLDTLKNNSFKDITGKDKLPDVIESIYEAEEEGSSYVKINCVVIKGINDNEIPDFVEFFEDRNVTIRFIEYMPFTQNGWDKSLFISCEQMKKKIENEFKLTPVSKINASVSDEYIIAGYKCKVGFISSISNHFCSSCNRLRITADGKLRLCLFTGKESELNLKYLLEDNLYADEFIAEKIADFLQLKNEVHPPPEILAKMDYNYMLKAGG